MNSFKQKREQNTENFLRSYKIQMQMSTVSGFDENQDMTTDGSVELSPKNPYDTQLQSGQIRLLSQLDRITYIVLLRRWEEDSFLTMTFSHYDFPATDVEFKPEFDGGMYLNVLQVWNTRTLQDETLEKSWLIGNLPEADCTDALAFWEHLITGRALSDNLLEKTGLPITDADDPRIQYIQDELAAFEQLDNAELASQNEGDGLDWLRRPALPQLWNEGEIALAAGDEKQDIVIECSPYGHEEFVTIAFSPKEKNLRVSIYTPDQSGYSTAFDSWELISADGSVLAIIQDGFALVQNLAAFDGLCALRNPADQTIVIFERRQN